MPASSASGWPTGSTAHWTPAGPGRRATTAGGNVILELVGSEGVLSVDAFRPHLDVTAGIPGRAHWRPWGRSPDHGLIDDFADMIRTGRDPSISGHDGLQALRVALAAYESAQTGQPVALDHG